MTAKRNLLQPSPSEARAAKARRLRWVVDGAEVLLPDPVIPCHAPTNFEPTCEVGTVNGRFHIFLSHVWATGQDQMRVAKQRLLELLPDISVFLESALTVTKPCTHTLSL